MLSLFLPVEAKEDTSEYDQYDDGYNDDVDDGVSW